MSGCLEKPDLMRQQMDGFRIVLSIKPIYSVPPCAGAAKAGGEVSFAEAPLNRRPFPGASHGIL